LCKEVGWELGDDLIVKMEKGVVTLRKSNGSKSTN